MRIRYTVAVQVHVNNEIMEQTVFIFVKIGLTSITLK